MKKQNLLALLTGAALLLSSTACGVSTSQSNQITTILTQIGNTLVPDLQQQRLVALAATPPDLDGAQCAGTLSVAAVVAVPATATTPAIPASPAVDATGALAVAEAIQKVAAVTNGTAVGALTVAEIASLYQPGSQQFNWALKTLETACIAKVHDINQAVNSTSGIITALPSILALAAAPVGA